MEEHRLNNTALKLKRLKVDYELHNNGFILRGTSFSKIKLFLTIIFPIVFFAVMLIVLSILMISPEIETIIFPKILLILPLVILYYGIKNLITLRKSKKNQIHITPGKVIIKNGDIVKKVFRSEEVVEILFDIKENSINFIGYVYIISPPYPAYLLVSLFDSNLEYLKKDTKEISDTFLMILNNNKIN